MLSSVTTQLPYSIGQLKIQNKNSCYLCTTVLHFEVESIL